MEKNDLIWLAGYLEGEGSFSAGPPSNPRAPIIQVTTTDEDVIQKVGRLLGVKYHKARPKKAKEHHKVAYRTALRGHKAVRLMERIRHLMGYRRQGQIDAALASYDRTSIRQVNEDDVCELLRLAKIGQKQGEIGVTLGFSRETVNKVLRGKRKIHRPMM